MSSTHEPLSQAEYCTLVEAAHQQSLRHGFTVYLIGHTGLARSETAEFVSEWYDSDRQRICVPESQGNWSPKSENRVREIPLSSDASSHISDYLNALEEDAFGVSPSTIYDRVTKSAKAANLESVSPHILRITYANRLQKLGLSQQQLASVLGIKEQISINSLDPHSDRSVSSMDWDECWPLYDDLSVYDSDGKNGEDNEPLVLKDVEDLEAKIEQFLNEKEEQVHQKSLTWYRDNLHQFKGWCQTESEGADGRNSPISIESARSQYISSECRNEALATKSAREAVLHDFESWVRVHI